MRPPWGGLARVPMAAEQLPLKEAMAKPRAEPMPMWVVTTQARCPLVEPEPYRVQAEAELPAVPLSSCPVMPLPARSRMQTAARSSTAVATRKIVALAQLAALAGYLHPINARPPARRRLAQRMPIVAISRMAAGGS